MADEPSWVIVRPVTRHISAWQVWCPLCGEVALYRAVLSATPETTKASYREATAAADRHPAFHHPPEENADD